MSIPMMRLLPLHISISTQYQKSFILQLRKTKGTNFRIWPVSDKGGLGELTQTEYMAAEILRKLLSEINGGGNFSNRDYVQWR